MKETLEDIIAGMKDAGAFCWKLSQRTELGQEIPVINYMPELASEVNSEESQKLLTATVKRKAEKQPNAVFIINYRKASKVNELHSFGPFEFTYQLITQGQNLAGMMPHQVSSLGYVPADQMEIRLALMQKEQEQKFETWKQQQEHERALERLREKEKQLEEERKEIQADRKVLESKSTDLGTLLGSAVTQMVTGTGSNQGALAGLLGTFTGKPVLPAPAPTPVQSAIVDQFSDNRQQKCAEISQEIYDHVKTPQQLEKLHEGVKQYIAALKQQEENESIHSQTQNHSAADGSQAGGGSSADEG